MVMGDSMGSSLENTFQRFIGTVLGAVAGYLTAAAATSIGGTHSIDDDGFKVPFATFLAAFSLVLAYVRIGTTFAPAASVSCFRCHQSILPSTHLHNLSLLLTVLFIALSSTSLITYLSPRLP